MQCFVPKRYPPPTSNRFSTPLQRRLFFVVQRFSTTKPHSLRKLPNARLHGPMLDACFHCKATSPRVRDLRCNFLRQNGCYCCKCHLQHVVRPLGNMLLQDGILYSISQHQRGCMVRLHGMLAWYASTVCVHGTPQRYASMVHLHGTPAWYACMVQLHGCAYYGCMVPKNMPNAPMVSFIMRNMAFITQYLIPRPSNELSCSMCVFHDRTSPLFEFSNTENAVPIGEFSTNHTHSGSPSRALCLLRSQCRMFLYTMVPLQK